MVSVIFDYCLSKLQVNEARPSLKLCMACHVSFYCTVSSGACDVLMCFHKYFKCFCHFFLTETAGHKLSPLDKFISGCLLDCFSCNNLPMCDLLTLSLTNFCCSVSKCCHGHCIYAVVMCIKAFFVAIPGWLSGQSICFSMSSTRAMHYHKLKFL